MTSAPQDRKPSGFGIGAILVAVALMLLAQLWLADDPVAELPYSRFVELLHRGGVADVTVSGNRIEGRLVTPIDGRTRFTTMRVDDTLAREFTEAGITFAAANDAHWLGGLLSWILPMAMFIGLWLVALRFLMPGRGLGGMTSVGKSRAKVYREAATGVTFDDVAGVDEAKAELMEVVAFLRNKERYGRLGAHVPKGILLVGPPGTGKTLLARAVAGEAGVPFFSISGSEFVEMFVGVGAARVRDLFEQARKAAPCIIFIDELDALGRVRTPMGGLGGLDEKEQTLNQLLAELDGFDPRTGIVLLAATNRPEILDPALLRAGRFDRQVALDRPDQKGRRAILRVHLKKVTLAPGVEADAIAALTPGFTGADLANLVNEAAIIATRHDRDGVTMDDFVAAVERIVAGSEMKSRVLKPRDRERVAYHELGHALVAAALPTADPVQRVSIIPRSIGALGYTLQRPTEDRFLITTAELEDRLTLLMAGRAAEAIVLGQVSTGAADDLAKATDVARQLVTRFGMSEALGQAVLEEQRAAYLGDTGFGMQRRDHSEATAREVDLAVRRLVEEAFERARRILDARRDDLEAGAALLLERETITPDDFPPLRHAPARVDGGNETAKP